MPQYNIKTVSPNPTKKVKWINGNYFFLNKKWTWILGWKCWLKNRNPASRISTANNTAATTICIFSITHNCKRSTQLAVSNSTGTFPPTLKFGSYFISGITDKNKQPKSFTSIDKELTFLRVTVVAGSKVRWQEKEQTRPHCKFWALVIPIQ